MSSEQDADPNDLPAPPRKGPPRAEPRTVLPPGAGGRAKPWIERRTAGVVPEGDELAHAEAEDGPGRGGDETRGAPASSSDVRPQGQTTAVGELASTSTSGSRRSVPDAPGGPAGATTGSTSEAELQTGDDGDVRPLADARDDDPDAFTQVPSRVPTPTPPKPPPTLSEYFDSWTSRPVGFLVSRVEAGRTFSREEIDAACAVLPDRDPDLSFTRVLASLSTTSQDGRLSAGLRPFFEAAIAPTFDGSSAWPAPASQSADRTFEQLVKFLSGGLHGSDLPDRDLNAILVAFVVLANHHGLEPSAAVGPLSTVFRSGTLLPGDGVRRRRTRIGTVADGLQGFDRLRGWLDVARPFAARATSAEARARRAVEEAEAATAEAERRRATIVALEAQLEQSRAETRAARAEAAGTETRLEGARVARRVDSGQLKGRMVGFLADDLTSLLDEADAALDLDPPRASFAKERIEDARHAVEGRVRWLRSSD